MPREFIPAGGAGEGGGAEGWCVTVCVCVPALWIESVKIRSAVSYLVW